MADADLKLILGADISPSVAKIKQDMGEISKQLSKENLLVKVGLDTSAITKQIPDIRMSLNNAFSKTDPVDIKVNVQTRDIETMKSVLTEQLNTISQSFNESGKASDDFAQRIENIRNSLNSLSGVAGVTQISNAINSLSKELKDIDTSNIDNLALKLTSFRTQTLASPIGDDGLKALEEAEATLRRIQSSDFGTLIRSDQIELVDQLNDAIKRVSNSFAETKAEAAKQKAVDSLNAAYSNLEQTLLGIGAHNPGMSMDASALSTYTSLLQRVSDTIGRSANAFQTLTQEVNQFEESLNASELVQISNAQNTLSAALDKVQSEFTESGRSSEDLTNRINELRVAIDTLGSVDGVSKLRSDIEALANELQGVDISKYAGLSSTLNTYRNQAQRLNINADGLAEIDRAAKLLQEIQGTGFKDLVSSEQLAKTQELDRILESIRDNLREASSENTLERSLASINAGYERLSTNLTAFGEKNSRIFQDADFASRYADIIERLGDTSNRSQANLTSLRQEVAKFESDARQAGLTTETLGEKIRDAYTKFGGWALVTSSMMEAVQVIQEMIAAVTRLDTAMTELKKVTDETDATYETFFSNAATQAKQIGTTMSDYISSTADFARLGYSLEDSEELATVASVYFNVADGISTIDEASQSVISTMKAFDVQVNESMGIVDLFNEVSNRFAISSGGIGEAMQRSASALQAAGNTMEESVALITAANSVVQDPMKVGNALKTLSMRLRGAKTELEDAGLATDGMAESTAKLREQLLALTGGQVDIMLDEDTFKSTYQILQEMSQVWNQMSDINQASALELMGGKEQANVLSSLLQNFETAQQVMETSQDATGSAMRENERYLDSINGKIAQFKTNFESLSATLIDSETVKGVVDFGSDALNVIDTLMQNLGTFPTLLATIAGAAAGVKSAGKIHCPLTLRQQSVGCLLIDDRSQTVKLLGMAKTLSPIRSRKAETRIRMAYAEIKAA